VRVGAGGGGRKQPKAIRSFLGSAEGSFNGKQIAVRDLGFWQLMANQLKQKVMQLLQLIRGFGRNSVNNAGKKPILADLKQSWVNLRSRVSVFGGK